MIGEDAQKVGVLIVDDHPLMRTGILTQLDPVDDIVVLGEAATGQEALKLVADLNPDIVLLDISMPEMSGLEVTRILKEQGERCKIIILSMHNSQEMIKETIRAGADGYVLKNVLAEEIVRAIHKVVEGHSYFSPLADQVIMDDYVKKAKLAKDLGKLLTTRELEIFRLLAEGHTHKEIGGKLFISPRTVETHHQHIMQKLNLTNLTELVKQAIAYGIISVEDGLQT